MERNALIGQRFGKWLVLECIGRNKWYAPLYKCLCDCGSEGVVQKSALLDGTSPQCGLCGRHDAAKTRTKPAGVVAANAVLLSYKRHAEERHHAWHLSKDEFAALIFQECHYCGAPPSQVARGAHRVLYNGIDRLDNAQGYVPGNVVTACGICNRWKSDMDLEAFLQHVQRICRKVLYAEKPVTLG